MSGKNQDRNVLLEFVEELKGLISGKKHAQNVPHEILDELNRPVNPSEMPRRVELCQQALEMISREAQPELWGKLQDDLACSLAQTPIGPRAKNLEQSIQHFEMALEVRTRQRYPKEWGTTLNNLASAYRDRLYGEQAENIEKAIHCYQQSLEVRTRQSDPEHWALTQHNLGIIWFKRIRGERAENLEQSIYHFEQALEVRTRQRFPKEWASTCNNLATAYRDRICGERAENIEKAIHFYQQALEVRTSESAPGHWAFTQNNLGAVYTDRIRGERAENLEQAIQHSTQALEVYNHESFPEGWAETQNTLGEAYLVRIHGIRAENIEQAIQNFDQALEVHTFQDFPQDWAKTHNNLGNAYLVRIRGRRSDNIEHAIDYYQKALKVYTFESFPQHWASIQYNLGNAYRERIRGDQAENIEQAIYHSQKALEVRTPKSFPEEYAQSQNNLGNIYLARIRGERTDNIKKAIRHFEEALAEYTRQAFPEDWAQSHNNLGNAYLAGISDKQAENIEQAIKHYEQALEVRTRHKFPEDWAQTQSNLAGAYTKRIRGEPDENIEQAIQYLEQVLKVRTRHKFPEDWAATQNNLAIAYADRKRGEQAENIKQSIHHYQQALKVYTHKSFPDHCLKSAKALGNLAFEQKRWELARSAYDKAFRAQDVLMQSSFLRTSKQAELGEAQSLPIRAAYTHVQLGEVNRAVEVLERGRAQLLREELERRRQDLEQLPNLGFEHLYQNYKQAMDEYTELQREGASESAHPEDWISKIDQVLEKVQDAVDDIRKKAGRNHSQYRFFMQALPFAEIQKQAHEKPLVYLSATSAGGLALVISEIDVQVIEIPDLKQETLQKQIWRPSNQEIETININIKQGIITAEDIQAVKGGYFSTYALWSLTPYLNNTPRELIDKLFEAWKETLDDTTQWLWEMVMEKLISVLKDHNEAFTLIPAGQLALLPLHAAWKPDTKPTGRLYALDEMNISYAPSAHALWQANLAAGRPAESLMVVDNPDGTLSYAKDEVQAVLDVFKHSIHLPGREATVEVVKEEMQKAQVLHFSTHGRAGWEKAEQAHLKLANDYYLTLPDIFDLDLNKTRLAVLSACETGMPGLELIDEMIGLPAGLMQAGVPGVVGSLWSVEDMSTAMLMARFYSLWREEEHIPQRTPQEALRQAQIWLRDSTTTQKKELFEHYMDEQTAGMSANTAQAFYDHIAWKLPEARIFASPFYWAAFTYTGI